MTKQNSKQERRKQEVRSIRVSNNIWHQLKSVKERGESWDLLFRKLLNIYKDR